MTDYGLMRDKVVLGLAKDFRAGTHAGPGGYALCVRLGVRRALSSDQLNRLVAIYRRPDGQVRHEMTVHDIEMEQVRAAGLDVAQLVAQPRKVGRE